MSLSHTDKHDLFWLSVLAVEVILISGFLISAVRNGGHCQRLYDRARSTTDTLVIATNSGCSLPEAH